MPGTESRGERRQVRSNRETIERNLDFIVMMRTSGVFWKESDRTWTHCVLCKCSNVSCLPLCPQIRAEGQNEQPSFIDEGGLPTQLEQWLLLASLQISCHCPRGFKLTFMTSKQPDFPKVTEHSKLALLGWKSYGINCKCFASLPKHISFTILTTYVYLPWVYVPNSF